MESLPHAEASYRAAVNTPKGTFIPGTRLFTSEAAGRWDGKRWPVASMGAGDGRGFEHDYCEMRRLEVGTMEDGRRDTSATRSMVRARPPEHRL